MTRAILTRFSFRVISVGKFAHVDFSILANQRFSYKQSDADSFKTIGQGHMSSTSLNSIRLLAQKKINHTVHEFPNTVHNAEEVANIVGVPADRVYKTLVILGQNPKTKPMLVMIAANQQLDLKQVAKAVKEKKIQMATHQEAERLTGLKVGGISALMLLNKGFVIYLDQAAQNHERILVSAGQRGVNVELAVADLLKVTKARWVAATTAYP